MLLLYLKAPVIFLLSIYFDIGLWKIRFAPSQTGRLQYVPKIHNT